MRLSEFDRAAIRHVTAEVAGPAARVYLFGSRTDDSARGGDIDLLLELPEPSPDKLELSLRTGAKLQQLIGLQKIDVLVVDPHSVETTLIRAARRQALPL